MMRVGRSESATKLWAKAVEAAPEELRHPYVPVVTCLWVAQSLAPDEAARWSTITHDGGLSLRTLQEDGRRSP